MKTLAITQARFGSSRLRGKVLKKINDKTLLEIHLERALKSKKIDKLVVATTLEDEASHITEIAKKLSLDFYQGSTNDVLDRFYQAAKMENPDYVVRITSDCPLIDAEIMDAIITQCIDTGCDYCSNTLYRTFPDGVDVEIFRFDSLEKAWRESNEKFDREHVTPFIWRNSTEKGGEKFKSSNYQQEKDESNFRLTVDNESDFQLIQMLINRFGYDENLKVYVDYLRINPEVVQIMS